MGGTAHCLSVAVRGVPHEGAALRTSHMRPCRPMDFNWAVTPSACGLVAANPSVWGTVPQWVSGVGTLVAFAWAVFLYRRSVADKRLEVPRLVVGRIEARRLYEAGRLFSTSQIFEVDGEQRPFEAAKPGALATHRQGDDYIAKVGVRFLLVRVANHSTESVSQVHVYSYTARTGARGQMIDVLDPGESRLVVLTTVHRHPDYDKFEPALRFVDAAGRRWSRRGQGPVRKWTPEVVTSLDSFVPPDTLYRRLKRSRRRLWRLAVWVRYSARWKDDRD